MGRERRWRGWAEEAEGPRATSDSMAIMAAAARAILLLLRTRLIATGQPGKEIQIEFTGGSLGIFTTTKRQTVTVG